MPADKRFWVWVTGPDYYLDENQKEREILDPKSGTEGDGWWTCHKDTREGDLVLLYRTRPRSDIAYLLEVKANARLLQTKLGRNEIRYEEFERLADQLAEKDKKFARLLHETEDRTDIHDALTRLGTDNEAAMPKRKGEPGPEPGSLWERWNNWSASRRKKWLREENRELDALWEEMERRVISRSGLPENTTVRNVSEWDGSFVCDYKPRFKLASPVTLPELRSDPFLWKEWGALRAGFRMRSYEIPARVWGHLVDKVDHGNDGFGKLVSRLQDARVSADILSEKEFEDRLTEHLQVFRPEFDLELYVDSDGRPGRQYPCVDAGGFIDLLCRDRRTGGLVVIELKVARVGRDVIGQITSYMGWVRTHLAGKKPVSGLIVGDGHDEKFRFAIASVPGLHFMEMAEIRKRLH